MKLFTNIMDSQFWRSIFRTRLPIKTNLDRSLIIFNSLALHIHPVKVRESAIRFSYTFYLGMITFSLFVVLVVTGILLMLYYQPAIPNAYHNMKDLQYVVSNGMFLRNMHRWAAHLMVIAVFLHMLRVFYKGAYRRPREFNWVIGVFLFLLTLLLSYTGYLLPYDQLSYWAVTVGANIVKYVPVVGQKVRFLLLGGNDIGEYTLVRFYVLHCVILPLVMSSLIGLHFWRIRKDGGLY
ncbi:MAG TPA: cytochrome b N-terminal domain-containing protein [Bacteroidales bacterium]